MTGDTSKNKMGESAGTGETLAYVIARDATSSSPGHGVAHSSRIKVSLQPYTVTDTNALTLVGVNIPVHVLLGTSLNHAMHVSYHESNNNY